MNCHIVPKVYLRSWKLENQPLYVFEKTKTDQAGVPKSIDMKGTSFTAEDAYLLALSNSAYVHSLAHELEPFYSRIADCSISYNHTAITTLDDFILFYSDMDKWRITTRAGDAVSASDLKSEIDRQWAEKVEKKIESYFDHNIENRWNTFLDYVNTHVSKRSHMVQAKHLDYFIEFVSIQICRVFKNVERLGLNKAIRQFDDIITRNGRFPKAQIKALRNIFNDDFKNGLCLILLYDYICFASRSNPADMRYENNAITAIQKVFMEGMQVIMLVSINKNAFITSDCPCICINTTMKYDPHFTGIYLPITPKVCALLIKQKNSGHRSKYLIVDVSDANVGYINYMMTRESIDSVVYGKEKIQGMLCKKPDLKSWTAGFASIGIGHQSI